MPLQRKSVQLQNLWGISSAAPENQAYKTLYAIAETLEVSLDYLIGRTVSPAEAAVQACLPEYGLTPEQEKLLKDLTKSMIPIIKDKI